jgi:hypothetical protein
MGRLAMVTLTSFVLGLSGAAISGCKSAEPKPDEAPTTATSAAVSAEFEGAPDWVRQSCQAYFGEEGTVVCGVGSAGGSRNISALRSAAMGRGRTEIARSLQVKVSAMLRDYQSTATGGEFFGEVANDEQFIEDVAKQVTDISLSGTAQKDTWISPTGTVFVLMVLELEKFNDAIERMGQLDERVRSAIEARARRSFGELDAEVEKLQREQ